MNRALLEELLDRFAGGELDRDALVERLATLPFRTLVDARVDTHRALRAGADEVVLGLGKTPEQIAAIASELLDAGAGVLVTRVDPGHVAVIRKRLPGLEWRPEAAILRAPGARPPSPCGGSIAVVTAGTADLRVAEEAAITLEHLGNKVERIYDVGVAGLHRLLASLDTLRAASVVVAVAGMEGALPSVVGGLIARPVIAVPTSVGYGASLGGVAALLGMLNSCASNVTVTNIDNGFGAAYVASLIHRGDPGEPGARGA